jgi:hypothetical protein
MRDEIFRGLDVLEAYALPGDFIPVIAMIMKLG